MDPTLGAVLAGGPAGYLPIERRCAMRIGSLVVVLWLVIGALAAYQRDYFSDEDTNCAKTSTVVVTVIAGPLNYVGVNPKVKHCKVPEPSK
jgi:hypothetical protein